jgi:hypothetical protein
MRVTRAVLVSVLLLADGPTPPTDLAMRIPPDSPQSQVLSWTPMPGAAQYVVALRQMSSLFYDQLFTVEASAAPEVSWTGFKRYSTVAVAAVDSSGRIGPLSPEVSVSLMLRR